MSLYPTRETAFAVFSCGSSNVNVLGMEVNMLEFLLQFMKNPRIIGAVAPSGKFLAKKMMEPIRFDRAKCIVEYGPGTGSFTKYLVKMKRQDTRLILIEQNHSFCKKLEKKFKNVPEVYVMEGGAEHVISYIKKLGFENADYIISGLPFTSLPSELSAKILNETCKAIGKKGHFITFQYSLVKRKFFEEYFRLTGCLLEMRNLPPAYVLVMKCKKGARKNK